jgi:hypothetical protein
LYPVTGVVPAFGGADHETVAEPTPDTADGATGAADAVGAGGVVGAGGAVGAGGVVGPGVPGVTDALAGAVVVELDEPISGTDEAEVPTGAVPTPPTPSVVVVVVEDDPSVGGSVGGGSATWPV